MATRWFYRLSEKEFGPVEFRELVGLVRDGTVRPDDPVRGQWEPEWHPAGSTPGLFHMAKRDEVWERWQAEEMRKAGLAEETGIQEEPAEVEAISGETTEPEPTWLQRLRLVTSRRSAEKDEQTKELVLQSQMKSAASAAIDKLNRRGRTTRLQRLRNRASECFSSSTLHYGFRFGMAAIAANVVAFAIISWSELQLLRYPDPKLVSQGIREFPLWGACEPAEFTFLVVDAMLLGGLLGYFAAKLLESLAED